MRFVWMPKVFNYLKMLKKDSYLNIHVGAKGSSDYRISPNIFSLGFKFLHGFWLPFCSHWWVWIARWVWNQTLEIILGQFLVIYVDTTAVLGSERLSVVHVQALQKIRLPFKSVYSNHDKVSAMKHKSPFNIHLRVRDHQRQISILY